ncbi:MAG: NirD/YgiW/YdeI family stress tolerance protein [Moritella sp.]|uniref:YgiW/YdeI family stress tolerance OB fold protein n=1 Tax=Moritella sp. TaxID=78556 RepID=UPI0029B5FA13|nr:NirD/YgiW/YdeI family stress tolerance protein [Moritella sp.]MDX2319073.1 NirD/YgiW/YdeI family stress tolerance protein [Moritella sp.]
MLKKTIIGLTAAIIMLPTLALAKNHEKHSINYTGPAMNVTTVAENLENVGRFSELNVVLEGKLIHQISGDKYMFADDSGQVVVELDDDIKLPVAIDNNTKLRIFGELEGGSTPEVEVKHIKLL